MKKIWENINFMTERKTRMDNEKLLRKNFQTDNMNTLSNQLNKSFIDKIIKLKQKNDGPLLTVNMDFFQKPGELTSLYLKSPQISDIHKLIRQMKITGPGPDSIRPKDIKNNLKTLAPIFTHLVKKILSTDTLPDELKVSSVTPIYKKGAVNDTENYRPIGSLSFLEKIFEKHLEENIKKYLSHNNILPNFQHGFQSNKSTITLLQDFSNITCTALDQRKFVVLCFIDLTAAFDTISHQNLLEKFQDIGINQKIFKDYFKNRKQYVKIGKTKSEKEDVYLGLVQGGINSPGWYNIYTYDIQYLKNKGHIRMFADDTCLIAIHRDLETAIDIAQHDLINLQKYFYNNKIYINEQKTQAMVLGVQKKQP